MDFTTVRDDEDDAHLEKRPGCLRRLFRFALIVLALLLAVAAALPRVASTQWGRERALARLNAALAPAELTCADWSMGWFRAPVLQEVRYADGAGIEATVRQVAFDRGLLRLLPIGTLSLGTVTLKNPQLTLPAAPPRPPAATSAPPPAFFLPVLNAAATVRIEEGTLTVLAGGDEPPLTATAIHAEVAMTSIRKPVAVQASLQIGGGRVSLGGRTPSPWDLFFGNALDEPETVTLKIENLKLRALRPAVALAAGEPWLEAGTAEGAVTLAMRSANTGSVDGGLLVDGLSVAGRGQAASPAGDFALKAKAHYDGAAVHVAEFRLSSPWARAEASGLAQLGAAEEPVTGTLKAEAELWLAATVRDFAPLLGLSPGVLVRDGALRVKLDVDGREAFTDVSAEAVVANLEMTVDGEPLALRPAPALTFRAMFPRGGLPEVAAFRLTAPFAKIEGSGKMEAATLKGRLDLTRFSRDFRHILTDCPPMVGVVELEASSKAQAGGVAVQGRLALTDVAAELAPGRRAVVEKGSAAFAGTLPSAEALAAEGAEARDVTFECAADGGSLKGGWTRWAAAREGRAPVLRGFHVSADFGIDEARRLLGGVLAPETTRALAAWQGRVVANATAEAAEGVTKARVNAAGQRLTAATAAGVWRIPDVRLEGEVSQAADGTRTAALSAKGGATLVADGETLFAEPGATLAGRVSLAGDGTRCQFEDVKVASQLLDLTAAGVVTEIPARCVADVKGTLALDFAQVTRLLEARGIDEFALAGRAPRAFSLRGALADGGKACEASVALHVASAKGLGLDAGAADLALRLKGGAWALAWEPPLNGGRMRAAATLSERGGRQVVQMAPNTKLLEGVTLTQGMMDRLVVPMNPLLQGCGVLEGKVDLEMERFVVEPAMAEGMSLAMRVKMDGLKVDMGEPLREVLALLKVKERRYEARRLEVRVEVKEGRYHLDPVTMTVGGQPVTVSGSTGFDGTIKYLVEVPVTERLVGKMAARFLGGTVIRIPLAGTVEAPRLDTSAVQNTLNGLLKGVIGEQATERVGTLFERLQDEFTR